MHFRTRRYTSPTNSPAAKLINWLSVDYRRRDVVNASTLLVYVSQYQRNVAVITGANNNQLRESDETREMWKTIDDWLQFRRNFALCIF